MKIEYKDQFSEDRVRSFFRFHLLKRSYSKYIYFPIAITLIVLGILMIFVEPTIASLILTAGIMTLIIRVISINSTVNSIFKKQERSTYNYTLLFSEEGISYTNDYNYTYDYKWSDVLIVCETKDYLYYYISKETALVVNKPSMMKVDRDNLLLITSQKASKYKKYFFKNRKIYE